MPSVRGIVIEIIGDATSYLRSAETTIASNTKLDESFKSVGVAAEQSAAAQVAAKTKVLEAQRAQVAALEAYSAKQIAGSKEAEAASLATADAQAKLNRSLLLSTGATSGFANATKKGETDLNKLVRGGLAGSGAFSALGRSLAFASSGFIAFAAGATLITKSIGAARDFAVAQKQAARQLEVTGKSFKTYGGEIDDALLKESHLSGFTRIDLLSSFTTLERVTGNVSNSLKITALAADVARGKHIALSAAANALAKAEAGSFSALRRLNIVVPAGSNKMEALAFVTKEYAGQAVAGTTVTQKFSATLVDTEEIIGTALLPTVNRLTREFGDWLAKMNESGRLQKDVNEATKIAGTAFHALGDAIGAVDRVTGSFKNTLEALIALKFASLVTSWVGDLGRLAKAWGVVGDAAVTAGTEQKAALSTSGVAGAEGAGAASAAGRGGALPALAIPATLLLTDTKVTSNAKRELHDFIHGSVGDGLVSGLHSGFEAAKRLGIISKNNIETPFTGLIPIGAIKSLFGGGGPSAPTIGPIGDVGAERRRAAAEDAFFKHRQAQATSQAGPVTFKTFTDTISNQLAQARAALTRSTADDVAAAKAEVAFIKKEIAAGHLKGQSLLQGLQAEASAVSTIQSAEAAAAQKRAAAAQALQAKIQAQIENSINPLSLQVELAREQASGKSTLRTLEKQRAAARKALRTENLTQQQQIEAYNEITSLNQQISDALKKQKKKIKDRANAFKELDLSKETAGLGLTRAQRKALEARLSQIGPGRTVPDTGTGAFGEVIGANGRPIHIHTRVDIDGKKVAENTTRHQQKHRRRNSSQRRGPSAGITG